MGLTILNDYVGTNTPEQAVDGDVSGSGVWESKEIKNGTHGLTIDWNDLVFVNKITILSGTEAGKRVRP